MVCAEEDAARHRLAFLTEKVRSSTTTLRNLVAYGHAVGYGTFEKF